MKQIRFWTLPLALALCACTRSTAQSVPLTATGVWPGDPTKGIPMFTQGGKVMTAVIRDGTTSGVQFREGVTGATYVYLPVSLPDKSKLTYLQITANGSAKVSVLAELLKISNPGDVQSLGWVATTSVGASGFGMQLRSSKLTIPTIIDNASSMYLVRVLLQRPDTALNPVIFDVRASDRCLPNPDPPSGVPYCPPGKGPIGPK